MSNRDSNRGTAATQYERVAWDTLGDHRDDPRDDLGSECILSDVRINISRYLREDAIFHRRSRTGVLYGHVGD